MDDHLEQYLSEVAEAPQRLDRAEALMEAWRRRRAVSSLAHRPPAILG